MPDKSINYSHTNDLYMQMLWDAKKIEDQRLVGMLRDRVKRKKHAIAASPMPTGNVIPLSSLACEPGCCLEPEKELCFWKETQFWHAFLPFMAMFSCWVLWFLFFITLLARDLTRL